MMMNIEVSPDLEHQLQHAAAQAGLTPDAYIIHLLRERLTITPHPPPFPHLSATETQLLTQINQSFAHIEWVRYRTLVQKRQAELLLPDEQQELIVLTDQIEMANVRRMTAVAELARIRNTTPEAVMRDFGLKPVRHA